EMRMAETMPRFSAFERVREMAYIKAATPRDPLQAATTNEMARPMPKPVLDCEANCDNWQAMVWSAMSGTMSSSLSTMSAMNDTGMSRPMRMMMALAAGNSDRKPK